MIHVSRRIARFMIGLQFSLPVQLLLLQITRHQLVLATWGFVFLVMSGVVLNNMGAQYLFLEPEYMNETGFVAMFLLGLSFGVFSLAYQMTCYILDGNYFYFLAIERRPFMTFSINNSLVPSAFWVVYSIVYFSFHSRNPELPYLHILLDLSGALLGGLLITSLSILYFSLRNKDILKLYGEKIAAGFRNNRVVVKEVRRTMGNWIRVDWYMKKPYLVERVQKGIEGDTRYLIRVLTQNQGNAIVLQVFLFLALVVMAMFQERPLLRLPAAASFMLLFAFVLMVIGALSYWLRRLAPLTVLVVGVGLYLINQLEPFVGSNSAFGLHYNTKPARYDPNTLDELASAQAIREDSLHTIATLDHWLAKNRTVSQKRPPLVLLCVSGGGNRSALWTMHTLQTLHRASVGKLNDQVALITGASGGMIGAAYWRELLRLRQTGHPIDMLDTLHLQNVSKDLLNSAVLNLAVNLLIPNLAWELENQRYEKDRGYAWEMQLKENLPQMENLRLYDYAEPEAKAQVPMLIFSPTIGNDGRHLYISPHPKSYLMRSAQAAALFGPEFSGVDFQRLFANHGANSLRFSTAVRMNATFPTILPYVELPTSPAISVLDAGVLDNFGVSTVTRFLFTFRKWIAQHTDRVVIIQIRDTQRIESTTPNRPKTLLSKLSDMLGGPIMGYRKAKDILNHEALARVVTWLDTPLELIELQYIPSSTFRGAALSFHLTEREKQDILAAMHNRNNQAALRRLDKLIGLPALEQELTQ